MVKPSQYLANFQAREVEIEEHKDYHGSYAETYRASTYRETAQFFAKMADAENKERRSEAAEAGTIGHALDIIETIDPNQITDGELACLVDFMLAKFVERDKPVAWARSGLLTIKRDVEELATLMRAACENDGYVEPAMLDDAADAAYVDRRAA